MRWRTMREQRLNDRAEHCDLAAPDGDTAAKVRVTSRSRTMIKLGSFRRQVPYRTIRPSVRGAASSTFAQDRGNKRQHLVGSLRQCVCCVECDPPQTGVSMWGGLRRPMGPFQVICVLAAA